MTAKYPSLFAALEVADRDGQRGSVVRCTATLRELGFVFWRADKVAKVVTWHWRAPDGQHGTTTTERNAVQRLRDLHKLVTFGLQPPDDATPAPRRRVATRRGPRIGLCMNSPACARLGCDDCERSFGPQHDATTTTTTPPAAPVAQRIDWTKTTTPPAAPAVAQRIDWTKTTTTGADLRDALARALDRRKKE